MIVILDPGSYWEYTLDPNNTTSKNNPLVCIVVSGIGPLTWSCLRVHTPFVYSPLRLFIASFCSIVYLQINTGQCLHINLSSRSFGSGDMPGIGSSTSPLTFRDASALSKMVSKGVAALPYALKDAPAKLTPFCYHVVKCSCDTAKSSGTKSYNP